MKNNSTQAIIKQNASPPKVLSAKTKTVLKEAFSKSLNSNLHKDMKDGPKEQIKPQTSQMSMYKKDKDSISTKLMYTFKESVNVSTNKNEKSEKINKVDKIEKIEKIDKTEKNILGSSMKEIKREPKERKDSGASPKIRNLGGNSGNTIESPLLKNYSNNKSTKKITNNDLKSATTTSATTGSSPSLTNSSNFMPKNNNSSKDIVSISKLGLNFNPLLQNIQNNVIAEVNEKSFDEDTIFNKDKIGSKSTCNKKIFKVTEKLNYVYII